MINYAKKITTDREFNPIESDRGHISSALAFRRLQKQAQVFAIELNVSAIHSLEVTQVAQFIPKTIY